MNCSDSGAAKGPTAAQARERPHGRAERPHGRAGAGEARVWTQQPCSQSAAADQGTLVIPSGHIRHLYFSLLPISYSNFSSLPRLRWDSLSWLKCHFPRTLVKSSWGLLSPTPTPQFLSYVPSSRNAMLSGDLIPS